VALAVVWLGALPVQAEVSKLGLTLNEHPARVDLYSPENPPRAAVLLAPGFSRSRQTMSGHATALARDGWLAMVADLPYLSGSPDNIQALVELIARVRAGAFAAPVDRVVLVGFSVGGLVTLLAAASPGVVGYIGLDPVDQNGGAGLAAAAALRTPAVLLHGPPSSCNARRSAAPWAAVLPALVEERLIENASHCDFESPSDPWCEQFCGPADPVRQQAVQDAVRAAVRQMLQ
jgi:dienelactone hydrolase